MLRSIRALARYRLQAPDGEAGAVADFIVDDRSWRLRYVVVDTGGLLPGKRVMLPSSRIRRVAADEGQMVVELAREQVRRPQDDRLAAPGRRRRQAGRGRGRQSETLASRS